MSNDQDLALNMVLLSASGMELARIMMEDD